MPGHDKSRIVGQQPSQLQEYTCSICQDVLCQPVVTACCRISYCKDCIEGWLTRHEVCPNDRKTLTRAGLSAAPRLVLNVIDNMEIRCEFTARGCPSVHTIGEEAEHQKVCEFGRCRICGFADSQVRHDCMSRLFADKQTVTEQKEKLETQIQMLTNLNKDLISSEKSLKDQNKALKGELNSKNNELGQLRKNRTDYSRLLAENTKLKNEVMMKSQQIHKMQFEKTKNKSIAKPLHQWKPLGTRSAVLDMSPILKLFDPIPKTKIGLNPTKSITFTPSLTTARTKPKVTDITDKIFAQPVSAGHQYKEKIDLTSLKPSKPLTCHVLFNQNVSDALEHALVQLCRNTFSLSDIMRPNFEVINSRLLSKIYQLPTALRLDYNWSVFTGTEDKELNAKRELKLKLLIGDVIILVMADPPSVISINAMLSISQ